MVRSVKRFLVGAFAVIGLSVPPCVAETTDLFGTCATDFIRLVHVEPSIRGSTLAHIMNGNFRNGQLTAGLHSWQGLEKFKDRLMRERGLTKAEVDEALRVSESPSTSPAILQVNPQYFPGSRAIQKTLFPRAWNVATIVDAIKSIASHPDEVLVKKNGERILAGVFRDCRIEIRVMPDNTIHSAYPVMPSKKKGIDLGSH